MYWNSVTVNCDEDVLGWIVTLDVLKWLPASVKIYPFLLNSNIRCIEIAVSSGGCGLRTELNSNIRCIEICYFQACRLRLQSLNSNIRCIEIYHVQLYIHLHPQLNSNIRCIEIYQQRRVRPWRFSWIVTLDVLK